MLLQLVLSVASPRIRWEMCVLLSSQEEETEVNWFVSIRPRTCTGFLILSSFQLMSENSESGEALGGGGDSTTV